jgi:hypothetical protein
VIATATANNHSDITKEKTKDTPDDPENGEYIDETATVVDNITHIPNGFIINPPNTVRKWNLNNSGKRYYVITLLNDSYYEYSSTESFIQPTECINEDELEVLNTVVLTEDDSGDTHDDDAKVIINIPECVCETAWGEGEKFSTGWAMYFYLSEEEAATTVDLIAAKHYDAGNVTVEWTEDGSIEVTYMTENGWKMKQVHVEVIDDPSEFPNWPKTPPPGQFEVNIEFHSDSPTYWNSEEWYNEGFDFGIVKDGGVFIAAHAVVINCDGTFEE